MLGLAIAALLIALNGFFVAAEFALVKLRATQLHPRIRKGDSLAIAAHGVVVRLDRYLAVTQFGVTLASLGLGWIGEPAIANVVSAMTEWVTGHPAGEIGKLTIVILAFILLTFAHVLFGELVPKLVAIQRSEKTALFVAHPLRIIYFTFRPLLWVLEMATRIILRAMGLKSDVASEGTLSETEILGILAANTARSPSGKEKSELLERVIRFAQRTARHSMVPRVDIVSLPVDASGEEALTFLRKQQFSRIVLTKGRSLDDVEGYLYTKDFLLDEHAYKLDDIGSIRRDVIFVPETQGLVDVLRDMQRTHTPIAVVVDEYGGTSGIVTMEDLLEEIVGEIRDEFDQEPAKVTKVMGEDHAWDVDGRAAMEELRLIGVQVEEAEAAEPIGLILLERLGRIPRAKDRVTLAHGVVAEVIALHRRRVTRVRVRVPKPPPPVVPE